MFILVLLCVLRLYGQQDTVAPLQRLKFPETGALVAYYFWEEDSAGILKHEPEKPFLQNFFILKQKPVRSTKSRSEPAVTARQIQQAINYFAHDSGSDPGKDEYAVLDSTKHIEKIRFPLVKSAAEEPGSAIFEKKNGIWESMKQKTVLYFDIDTAGNMRFARAGDSVVLLDGNVRRRSNSQYMVYNYLGADGRIALQRVFNYEGEDVTSGFAEKRTAEPVRMLIFINGYRGPKKNDDPTDGLVTQKDRYTYWYKIDNQFIETLKPAVTYYIDGSFPIATSNHKTRLGFAWSYARTRFSFRKKRTRRIYAALNTRGNKAGFKARREKGAIAGSAFLYARCNSPECETVKDTVDIVCHSMGYAYSLGLIEAIEQEVVLGNMYIIAPENACMEGMDWTKFRQVWQYGTNLDQENPAPLKQQDGIAPQCAVKGLDKLPAASGGRAFFPADWPNMNFIDSHMVYSYDWIFKIREGEPGFVKR